MNETTHVKLITLEASTNIRGPPTNMVTGSVKSGFLYFVISPIQGNISGKFSVSMI